MYSLRKIRWEYIRSGWFFLNLLASIPGTFLAYIASLILTDEKKEELFGASQWFFLLEMFKLFRLLRFNKLLSQSAIVSRVWEVMNVATALMTKFLFLICLFSHWIGKSYV